MCVLIVFRVTCGPYFKCAMSSLLHESTRLWMGQKSDALSSGGLPAILGDDPSTFFKARFVSNFDFSLSPLILHRTLAPLIHYLPTSPSASRHLCPPPFSTSPFLYLPFSLPTIHNILRWECVYSFFFIVIVVWGKKKTFLEKTYSKIVTCVHSRSFVDASCTCDFCSGRCTGQWMDTGQSRHVGCVPIEAVGSTMSCSVPFFRALMMRKVRTMMCRWGSSATNRKISLHTRSSFTTMHPQSASSWRETL